MILFIAVCLSMDAFSLSLAYGTLNINKKDRILLSIIVGIYHFIMPLVGLYLGIEILELININPKILVMAILSLVGIQMIFESKEQEVKELTKLDMLLFGLAVSLDSFSVGLALSNITNNYLLSYITFSITSLIFTYLGLSLGKYINNKIGSISTIVGGVFLVLIGIIYAI